jgi:hypothetical protein
MQHARSGRESPIYLEVLSSSQPRHKVIGNPEIFICGIRLIVENNFKRKAS